MKKEEIRKKVRESYSQIAQRNLSCCTSSPSCCGKGEAPKIILPSGYSESDLESVPEEAKLSLGCGNPIIFSSIRGGETVVDLGSGFGLDCLIASRKVGENGKVIGVDMTPEMINKARINATRAGYSNVEFRLGEIENLPIADNVADVVISNCVINLSPDKERVFQEAYRILKPGGRILVSDIVFQNEPPRRIRENLRAYVECIGGAILKEDYLSMIRKAGFQEVKVLDEKRMIDDSGVEEEYANEFEISLKDARKVAESLLSITVYGLKPYK
ncbi:arsenite methyltransferase [Candidatus Bathyarchaeota archaeon]|nr:arsenite methyltransferase [Candidatus Bathyarchaeota archaeon]MBS7631041.1 arsenite methyltransferase [Candidatus Bathyarchaeota archaeon]